MTFCQYTSQNLVDISVQLVSFYHIWVQFPNQLKQLKVHRELLLALDNLNLVRHSFVSRLKANSLESHLDFLVHERILPVDFTADDEGLRLALWILRIVLEQVRRLYDDGYFLVVQRIRVHQHLSEAQRQYGHRRLLRLLLSWDLEDPGRNSAIRVSEVYRELVERERIDKGLLKYRVIKKLRVFLLVAFLQVVLLKQLV